MELKCELGDDIRYTSYGNITFAMYPTLYKIPVFVGQMQWWLVTEFDMSEFLVESTDGFRNRYSFRQKSSRWI